ncbi:MAG: acylphosphatase [Erysipelotrichaceae bacterium]|nr:acylphosphatase [Erysipelotrichaceae bacterium]
MKRFQLYVRGRVQGVGFRYTCQARALTYHLTGYCENFPDGTVYVEIQGNEEDCYNFIRETQKPDRFIRVDDIEIHELPVNPKETRFKVAY